MIPGTTSWNYPPKTNEWRSLENPPWMKMYFLLNMVIFECHSLVFRGCMFHNQDFVGLEIQLPFRLNFLLVVSIPQMIFFHNKPNHDLWCLHIDLSKIWCKSRPPPQSVNFADLSNPIVNGAKPLDHWHHIFCEVKVMLRTRQKAVATHVDKMRQFFEEAEPSYLKDHPRYSKWWSDLTPIYKPWSSAIWKGNNPLLMGTY